MYDAIVVGGGIVGMATCYHLARSGLDAGVIDRADEGRATDAGAGIVSPATSSRTDSEPWFRFALPAADYYSDLAATLRAAQKGPVGYARPGLVQVAFEGETAAFDAAMVRVRDRQDRYGRPEPGSVTELDPAEARERFPALAEPRRAVHYADAARVDGRLFTAALRRAGQHRGLDVRRASAESVRVEDGRVTGVETGGAGTTVETEAVVVAGGAWSGEFGDSLGVAIPVEPCRGQIVHLDDVGAGDWPLASVVGRGYAVPWADGSVAVGATREHDAGFAPHPTAGGVHEVLDRALGALPGLADAAFEEVRVGLRPATPDGLPVIGGVPGVEGAYLATGHGPTGLQLGPYTGKVVAELVGDGSPEVDLDPFGVERFDSVRSPDR